MRQAVGGKAGERNTRRAVFSNGLALYHHISITPPTLFHPHPIPGPSSPPIGIISFSGPYLQTWSHCSACASSSSSPHQQLHEATEFQSSNDTPRPQKSSQQLVARDSTYSATASFISRTLKPISISPAIHPCLPVRLATRPARPRNFPVKGAQTGALVPSTRILMYPAALICSPGSSVREGADRCVDAVGV